MGGGAFFFNACFCYHERSHHKKIPTILIDTCYNNNFRVKTIIRTSVGSHKPLNPQHQHIGDFTESVKKMCTSIDVIKLNEPEDIFPSYKKALERNDNKNTILVEFGDYYNEK